MSFPLNHGPDLVYKMRKCRVGLTLLACLLITPAAFGQRQMEKLGRGIVAVRTGTTSAYVGWRLLGTDPENISFNLLRSANGATPVQLNGALITTSCNFNDTTINFAVSNAYFIQPVVSGVTQNLSAPFGLAANIPTQQYLNIPLQKPPDGTNDSGPYTYSPNDCSAADLDGDGEYEIILKWDPSNSKDNSQSGFTGNVYLDAYKLNGTLLWRIDLGPNIRAGAHYTQFMVYDLDGDGRAELACKTAPGTRDGLGAYVDGNANFSVYTNSSGYILSGPEYFTIFNGLNGAKLWNTNYNVPRGTVSNWGDSYGNRVDRFLACIAYLDGVRPSVVMCRGYYTRATLCAWDWRNGVLTQRWLFDTGDSTSGPLAGYRGQGAHSLTVGDVDGDGKDEITYGACAIDDNGTGLYTTLLGHGDALHQSDMQPDRDGLEVWMVHEDPGSYGPTGLEFRDAKDGELIFGVDGEGADVGRGVAIDVDPNNRGYEMWGARGGFMSATGTQIGTTKPTSQNFACYWDADLLREPLDGTTIYKWNPANNTTSTIFSGAGIASNNSTKSTPNLSADLSGDWREEIIWRTSDNLNLRIYTTTTIATNRLVTLMHDPAYREAIAWQNVAYNQPPHPGFYLGPGMFPPPVPPCSTADLVWRGSAVNTWDAAAANWVTNGIWSNANPAVPFINGRSVLFDLSGSNQTSINLSGELSPSRVTVHTAKDYTFAGAGALTGPMKLVKAGPARLTVNNTNTFTDATVVSGGALFVNGALTASPVTVERRGTPEGPSQFGGVGRLGQGLTLQNGCVLTVGPGTNSVGQLTITNGLTEQGNVRNQFDLSNDPSGTTKSNDVIQVVGNLTVSGTNILQITQLDPALGGGVYPLIKYSGTLQGGISNFIVTGAFVQNVTLTNPPGQIALLASIPANPPNAPSALVATAVGAFQINLAWTDNAGDENAFFVERATGTPAAFARLAQLPPNSTNFVDTSPAASTTYFYRVYATNLAGASSFSNTNSATTTPPPSALTWRGDGSGNLWDLGGALNWSDGANLVVFNDGAIILFDQSGSNNTTIASSGILQPASITVNATKNYTLGGVGILAGNMAFTKLGPGTFTLNNTNTFSGGLAAQAGILSLGNNAAAGTGSLRFNGGTVTFSGSGQPTFANAFIVNSNSTLNSSGGNNNIVSGAWTGTNTTLTVAISSSGTFTLAGNMTGFNGTVALGNSGGFFRFNGSTGSAATLFDLGNGTSTLNNRSGATVNLGGLTGGGNTIVSGASAQDGLSTYNIGGKNLSTTFNGTITNLNAARSLSLNKVGSGTLILNGNAFHLGTTTVSAGKLIVNGNQIAAPGNVAVAVGATLGGNGIIGGPTTVNGFLAPGASAGTLTFSSNLILATTSTCQFEVSRNPFTNDLANVTGTLTLAGTLSVLNTSIEALEAGDAFQLFKAASFAGGFANYQLPALDEGLAWNTSQLATNGWLWVVATNPPVIQSFDRSGGNLSLSGDGGTPNWNFDVLTTTNVNLPFASWSNTAAGQFDASGSFNVTVPVDATASQRFYLLRAR